MKASWAFSSPLSDSGFVTLPNGTTLLAKWKSQKNTENNAFLGASLPLCQPARTLKFEKWCSL
jgi:hypothetical protein